MYKLHMLLPLLMMQVHSFGGWGRGGAHTCHLYSCIEKIHNTLLLMLSEERLFMLWRLNLDILVGNKCRYELFD